jgi:hypothetical protein
MSQADVHEAPRRRWHRLAHDAGSGLATLPGPVCFVLGAGASISSKCPTTAEVDRKLRELTRSRFPGRFVRDVLHHFSQTQVQLQLAPLFAHANPYIGYLSLAALGRHRRVHVLNLNWDPMLKRACDELGVASVSFDLRSPPSIEEVAKQLADDSGLLIAHVHGRLGEECRYEQLSTLKFDTAEKDLIAAQFFAHPRVFIGASLLGDSDLKELLWNDDGSIAPTWYFGRPVDLEAEDELRATLPHRTTIALDCDVEFDDLLVIVLGQVAQYRWDDFRADREPIPLEGFSRIAWPRGQIMRPVLSRRICPLVGSTRIGKSTVAHLLAYLKLLWYLDDPRKGDVRTFRGPQQTVAALSSLESDSQSVLVLEDVFGATRFDDNPTLRQELARVSVEAQKATVILTSRLDRWHDADAIGSGLESQIEPTGQWYRRTRLRQFAREIGARERPALIDALIEAINDDRLHTPAQIADEVQGVARTPAAEVEEKRHVLEQADELASLCTLVRLSEFHSEPVTTSGVERQFGLRFDEIPSAKAFLHDFSIDGEQCLRLGHPEDLEAVDRYLEQLGPHHVTSKLTGLAAGSFEGALQRWSTVRGAERGDFEPVLQAPAHVVSDVAGDLLRVGWSDERVMELLIKIDYDQWALLDLAYELVRLWSRVRASPLGPRLLERILDDRIARGAYAVLEACLYLPHTAAGEIWDTLRNRLWQLLKDPLATQEVALAVDALLWRPPPAKHSVDDWLARVESRFGETDAAWALWRFAAAYHPAGARSRIAHSVFAVDRVLKWSEQQAEFGAWLVAWHFAHQSRARAVLARQSWVDKDFLCRGTYPEREGDGSEDVERLVQSLVRFPGTAPWAIHVACNIMSNPSAAPVTADVISIARAAFGSASPAATGVISAVATYESAATFGPEIKRYFAERRSRDALLRSLSEGIDALGTVVVPPRFVFSLKPELIYALTDLKFPRLEELANEIGLAAPLVATLLPEVRRRVPELVAAGYDRRRVEAAVTRGERGDLDRWEEAAAARPAADGPFDPFRHLLELATLAETVPSEETGTLF